MNLFELFVKIGVDDQASSNLSKITDKLGNGLKTAAKVGVAAIGAASTAIIGLTKSAVENYAEYEQLVGGVETLFQGSQKSFDEFTKSIGTSWWEIAKYQKEAGLAVTGWLDTSTLESLQAKYEAMANAHNVVLENAANAYKTAGMSANEYMETVTSFSASLIQSLGGDTAAAAEYADRAIISMSDNANKMGTSIDMIQNAYQGFAKQNYTMLDNLKLGYGGTQTEMKRLIEDASKMTDVQERLGITVDKSSMSFDNIVNAIQVVQENMGIAGATALEAGTTIEGSVNSMKAAWQNLLTGISDGNADVGKLMDNFVTTIVGDGTERNLGVLGNVLPTVKTALNGIGKLIKEAVPVAMQYIPQIIGEFLPTIGEAAIGIVTSIGTAIFDNLDQILNIGIDIIEYLKNGIVENMPTIVESATEIVNTLSQKIVELSSVLAEAAFELVDALGNELSNQIPGLSLIFENLETAVVAVTAAMVAYKTASAIAGVIDALRKATEGQTLAQTLLNAVMNANPFVLIATLIAGLVAAVITLWHTNEGFRNAVISAWKAIKSAAETIFTAVANFFTETIPNAFQSMIDWIIDGISSFVDIGHQIVDSIMSGISAAWDGLVSWFNEIWDSLFGNRTVDVDVDTSDGAPSSRANGLSYVPYDGYYALLHEGERVLTAEENKAYNRGATGNTSGITIIQNIQSVPQTPVEFAAATEAYFEQARWAFA